MSPSGDPLIQSHPGAAPSSPSAEFSGEWPEPHKLEWLTTGVIAVVVAFYFGLVPLGQWQADEYDYFGRLRQGVAQAFLTRLHWSPRPLGETFYLAYGLLANYCQRPLTGLFLGMLWAGFLLCACATGLTIPDKERRPPALLLGLGLAAAFLTSGPLYQVFFWPAGAVAYLPTLSATLLLSSLILYGRPFSRSGRLLCSVCLLVAALSSEMGAIFAACFALLQALGLAGDRRHHDYEVAWWLVPGVASVAVLSWVATHRFPANEAAFTVSSAALHRPLRSAAAAGGRLALEIAGWSSGTKHVSIVVVSLLARLAFAAGATLLWRSGRTHSVEEQAGIRRELVVVGGAFLLAALASLFLSYLHFGMAGGERYETLRRCWILMTYVAGMAAFEGRRLQRARWRLAPVLLLVGVLVPWHLSPLARQYAAYGQVRDAVKQTFSSGYQRGTREMIFVLPPKGGVITPATPALGSYTLTSHSSGSNYAVYLLRYFGKHELEVFPAQTDTTPSTGSPVP